MTLNEAFAHALKENPISHLEMSWNMKITTERLDELLHGASYSQSEELDMFRFIFKMKNKKNIVPIPKVGPVVPAHEKSNGI